MLIAAALVWCFKIKMDPERVFWGTVENSLATNGVTIQSEQESNGTKAKQLIRYSFGVQNLAHTRSTLSQGTTTVQSETIATPTEDFTRYINIKTDQKRKDGGEIDFSKVLGVWAKGRPGSSQFFAQAVFGGSLPIGGIGVPFANLPSEQRAKLVQQIHNDVVYQIDFGKTKKERTGGRLLYTYHASLQPVGYLALMKQFSKFLGLHGLEQLNPEDYRGQKPFVLDITVDAYAHQVVSIAAPETKTKQAYLNHGVPVQIVPPTNAIAGEELQKRLNNLQ